MATCHISRPLDRVRILRVFHDGKGFGDPYAWGCVLLPTSNPFVVEMSLVHGAPTLSEAKAIAAAMRELGLSGYMRRDGDGRLFERKL